MVILMGLASAGSSTPAQDSKDERTVFLAVTVTEQSGQFLTQRGAECAGWRVDHDLILGRGEDDP